MQSHDSWNEKDSCTKKFIDEIKFNRYKFECTNDDLSSTVDESKFKQKWLKKIEKMFSLIGELKSIQLDQLDRQGAYNSLNHAQDKKIIDLTFEIIKCYFEKIKNNLTQFTMQSKEKGYFDNFYLQFVFSLNNWLDVCQSNLYHLFILFEENSEYRSLNKLSIFNKLSDDIADKKTPQTADFVDILKTDLNDELSKKQVLCDYKKKMLALICNFNNEVIDRVSLNDDEKMEYSNGLEKATNDDTKTLVSILSTKPTANSQQDSSSLAFKKLDCLSIESDNVKHEFLKPSFHSQKKIQTKINVSTLVKELNLLRCSLPESGIYFRTFEERLDLISLMIEGPKDTAYENHLFLFDLKITDTLQEPPDCYYLSFGKKQINPNLYPDGNVCLSLLNTFFSKNEAERWQADRSSLLQLALSLQALVLNANPYFNEGKQSQNVMERLFILRRSRTFTKNPSLVILTIVFSV